MTKHTIAAYAMMALALGVAAYSISEMRSERAHHDSLSTALATRLAKCEASNDEWSELVQKFAYDKSTCDATVDFNKAIGTLDKAVKLQKQGKLPPPEKVK